MINIFKYNNIIELEKKYQNYFKLANKITLLPPILKKIGIKYYICFMAVEMPNLKNYHLPIKRPIGLILFNKNLKEEMSFDLNDYEFCFSQNDFEKEYFLLEENENFWPNKTDENEEKFKIILDKLLNICKKINLITKPNDDYQKYINKIKDFIPDNYWIFYKNLMNNEIIPISKQQKNKREDAKLEHEQESLLNERSKNVLRKERKFIFLKKIRESSTSFVKKEIIPSLKGKGSYFKLEFFNAFGEFLKNQTKNISNYGSCFEPEIPQKIIDENIENATKKMKLEIIKIYSNIFQFKKTTETEIVCKLLIIFLNSMLVEEIKNANISSFENQIEECIELFNEEIISIQNATQKGFLTNIFNSLCKDYQTANELDFSPIYFAYLNLFKS